MGLERLLVLAETNIAIDAHNRTLLFGVERQTSGAAPGRDSEDDRFHGLLHEFVVIALALAKPIAVVVFFQLAKETEAFFRKSGRMRLLGHDELAGAIGRDFSESTVAVSAHLGCMLQNIFIKPFVIGFVPSVLVWACAIKLTAAL